LNSTELSVISTGKSGLISSVNRATEKLLAYETDELIGKRHFIDLIEPLEIQNNTSDLNRQLPAPVQNHFDAFVYKVATSKNSERRQWTYIRKDATPVFVSLSLSAIWDERGEVTGYIAIATDITEQKRADEELRRSRNHLNALVQSLDDIVLEVDAAGTYLNLWTAREDLLFEQREAYAGKRMRDVLDEDLASRYQSAITRALETGKPEFIEYPSIKKGDDLWYLGKITPFSATTALVLVREITEQKKSESALRDSEQKFRLLTENVPGVIYLCHNDDTFSNLFISKNIERISGYSTEDFLNGTIDIQHLIHPEDRENIDRLFRNALKDHRNYKFEYRIVHRSGEVRWVAETGGGLYNEQGLGLIEGYLTDITDQKNGEIAIKQSEQKFRQLAENIPGVVYLCEHGEHFRLIYVNDNIQKVTGRTPEEFLSGRVHFADLVHPDDMALVQRRLDESIPENRNFHIEYRLLRTDGAWRWVEDMGTLIANEGQPTFLEGFFSDITERKITEAELEKVASENFRIFNFSPCLQAVITYEGYFKRLNPIWEKTLGWSVAELMAGRSIDFIHPDDVAPTIEAASNIIQGNQLASFENRYRCKDGSYRWLLWSSVADVESGIINASALDITERKKAEQDLRLSKTNLEVAAQDLQQQNRQLNEFAHLLSHNLRSPVRNISALISLLDKESTINDYQEVYKNLKKTAVNLSETLDELLDILRVKKERTAEKTVMRFEDILRKNMEDLMGEILHTNARINFNFKSFPEINYYKPYLESIMLNLLSNAIKYRFPGRVPEISFQTADYPGGAVLIVKDNGLGIDLQKHGSQLFGLRKVFHDHKEARGVGLFLTKTQVETMGGKIKAESEVGKGTTFTIEF
jgi:PAS domain S-box-containing protein